MADETKETTQAKGEVPPLWQKPEAKTEEKTAPKAETKQETKTETVTRARISGDGELPDDADLLELTPSALKKRLNGHTKRELEARFGTSDFESIKTKLARLEELEKGEEERKRADLSEQEKLKADLAKERALRLDAEERARMVNDERVVEKEEARIQRIASKHIKGKYVKHLYQDFAQHLAESYTDEQLKVLKDKDIEKWFQNYAEKEDPSWAVDYEGKAAGEKEAKTEEKGATVKVSNGALTKDRPAPAQTEAPGGKKNFSPSAENAMSRGEARAEAAKQGFKWA